jgi:hypothetical protein
MRKEISQKSYKGTCPEVSKSLTADKMASAMATGRHVNCHAQCIKSRFLPGSSGYDGHHLSAQPIENRERNIEQREKERRERKRERKRGERDRRQFATAVTQSVEIEAKNNEKIQTPCPSDRPLLVPSTPIRKEAFSTEIILLLAPLPLQPDMSE